MFLALISVPEVKGRDYIFCPAAVTVTYMLPVQDGTLLATPVERADNESICMKH